MANYTQRHATMLRLHGKEEGETCGTCAWLRRHKYGNRIVYKCPNYLDTMSVATDWRKKWQACGLHYRDLVGEIDDNT